MLADRTYCYPLTITDFASRYLLSCESLGSTREALAFTVFQRVFHEFGLPKAIRTDNGVPFASAHALFGLSKLAVWWLRLGISIERIKPGCPQQNGRHERERRPPLLVRRAGFVGVSETARPLVHQVQRDRSADRRSVRRDPRTFPGR